MEKRAIITKTFLEECGPEISEQIADSLTYLKPQQLNQVIEAIRNHPDHLSSIAHDIHGLAQCVYGPKYHTDTFSPRLVGRTR